MKVAGSEYSEQMKEEDTVTESYEVKGTSLVPKIAETSVQEDWNKPNQLLQSRVIIQKSTKKKLKGNGKHVINCNVRNRSDQSSP